VGSRPGHIATLRHNEATEMDLYLVRHAVAFDPDETQWPDDRQRPLTPQGEKRFRRAARGLGELVPSVAVVLSSPWVRAWRTAELLEKEAGWPKPIRCEALESGRAPAEVLQALQPYAASTHADDGAAAGSNGSTVALVGHEPNLHELASYLLTADTSHAQIEFRKGGIARLEVSDTLRPGAARLRWLLAPKVLRALAP
jgi:phosphohistidine phosphatase